MTTLSIKIAKCQYRKKPERIREEYEKKQGRVKYKEKGKLFTVLSKYNEIRLFSFLFDLHYLRLTF